jgi:hypothetical protein
VPGAALSSLRDPALRMTSGDAGDAAPESAEMLLAALGRLEREGRLELHIDPRPLGHIDSPVASEADGNIWIYATLAVAGALLLWRGLIASLVASALGVAIYFTVGRTYVHRRIERRVRDKALVNLDSWRKLWRFRGLTLVAKGRPDLGACASPDGNWMAFVRALS